MKGKRRYVIGLLGLGLLVAGCGGEVESPASEVEPTAAVEALATETSAPAEPAETPTELPAAEAGGPRTFEVITAESTATYIVQEEFFAEALEKLGIEAGQAEVIGVSPEVSGELTLDLDNPGSPLGPNQFTVDLTVLKTERSQRDNWIQDNGPSFGRFPLATFEGTEVRGFPDSYTPGEAVTFELVGDLTIREVTQTVTFDVTAQLDGETLTGRASTALQMTDFGIEPPSFANTLTVANDFELLIELVAREQ